MSEGSEFGYGSGSVDEKVEESERASSERAVS